MKGILLGVPFAVAIIEIIIFWGSMLGSPYHVCIYTDLDGESARIIYGQNVANFSKQDLSNPTT